MPSKHSTLPAEMSEFSSFQPAEQRYIRQSLAVKRSLRGEGDAIKQVIDTYARTLEVEYAIREQLAFYQELLNADYQPLRCFSLKDITLLPGLLRASCFDLMQYRLFRFDSYRFLYERLIGPQVRPLLPAVFTFAAGQPLIQPNTRKILLQSLTAAEATAVSWPDREPIFFPEWIDDGSYPA